jgi:hypothetical protein
VGFAEALIAFIVVGLPVIALAVLVMRTMKYRERKLELEAQIVAAKAVDGEYTRRLEERLRVVERIVTDQGHGVAHEIERLRDERVRSIGVAETQGN